MADVMVVSACPYWSTYASDSVNYARQPVAAPAFTTLPSMTVSVGSGLGLQEDGALVCDERETPGDAPTRCGSCGRGVRVPVHQCELFAGDDRPEVLCVDCHTARRRSVDPARERIDLSGHVQSMDLFVANMKTIHDESVTFYKKSWEPWVEYIQEQRQRRRGR